MASFEALLASGAATALAVGALRERRAARLPQPLPPGVRVHISGLFVYPLKGGRGHSVATAELEARGLLWDRTWMVTEVDPVEEAAARSRGEVGAFAGFQSQRSLPLLATLTPFILTGKGDRVLSALPADAAVERVLAALRDAGVPPVPRSCEQPTSLLLVADTAHNPLPAQRGVPGWFHVPLTCAHTTRAGAGPAGSCLRPTRVWSRSVDAAVDQGDGVAAWLDAVLRPDEVPEDGPGGGAGGGEPTPSPAGAAAAGAGGKALPPRLRLLWQDPAFAPARRGLRAKWLPLWQLHPEAEPKDAPPEAPARAAAAEQGAGASSEGALQRWVDRLLTGAASSLGSAVLTLHRLLLPARARLALWSSLTGIDPSTSFADGFPILLANESSLAHLNSVAWARAEERVRRRLAAAGVGPVPAADAVSAGPQGGAAASAAAPVPPGASPAHFRELVAAEAARVGLPLPMERFRPNVVVRITRAAGEAGEGGAGTAGAGCGGADLPWAEDAWTRLSLPGGAGARLLGVKRCDRCVVTTTDQRSGKRGAPVSAAVGATGEAALPGSAAASASPAASAAAAAPLPPGAPDDSVEPLEREPLSSLSSISASHRGPREGVFFGMNVVPALVPRWRGLTRDMRLWGMRAGGPPLPVLRVGDALSVDAVAPTGPF